MSWYYLGATDFDWVVLLDVAMSLNARIILPSFLRMLTVGKEEISGAGDVNVSFNVQLYKIMVHMEYVGRLTWI